MTDADSFDEAMIRSITNDDLTFRFNVMYRDILEQMKELRAENTFLKNKLKKLEEMKTDEDRINNIELKLNTLRVMVNYLESII